MEIERTTQLDAFVPDASAHERRQFKDAYQNQSVDDLKRIYESSFNQDEKNAVRELMKEKAIKQQGEDDKAAENVQKETEQAEIARLMKNLKGV